MVRGEGAYVWDSRGNRYLDGLVGPLHEPARPRPARHRRGGARAQAEDDRRTSPCGPTRTRTAIELAEKLATLTPGDLNRVFFTTGGSEAVESAWKLARQYHRLRGDHDRYKVISRDIAYHGTTMGALTITSVIPYRTPFEPLVPGAIKVPNTNFYRAREHGDDAQGVLLLVRRPDRRGDPARGPRDRRGRLLGAGAERGWLLHPAAGLLPAGPRDLRPLWRPVRLRRGDLRVRSPRHLVRRPEVRLRPGHDHRAPRA